MPFQDLPNKVLCYYASQAESKTRGYIGASILGHGCERRIWLDWKGCQPPVNTTPIEILKTGSREEKFDRGRHEEERLIKALQGAGNLVLDRLVIKTTQEKYFNALVKNGVQKTFANYYLQCQMYMHFFKIPRTLFLAVNKNNGEIYQVVLEEDEAAIEMGLRKINKIISHGKDMPAALADANDVPPKMPCQYCDFVSFCYQKQGETKGETSA